MRIFDIFANWDPLEKSMIKHAGPAGLKPRSIPEAVNPTDRVTMDIPLLLRIMEYSREDAKTDIDLHRVVEKLVELSATGDTLTMDRYADIVDHMDETAGQDLAPAEKLIHDIEYTADEEEDVHEGYGRYWCSTDKRWKERQGPKQSRG